MLTLLLINVLSAIFNIIPVKAQATIIVPDDYAKIQWAIGNASDGDTILVKAGTYHENVVVDKTVSLIGENRNNTIIDGNGTGTVVTLKAPNVEIKQFTIQNGGDFPYCGIFIAFGDNLTVSNNTIRNNAYGIQLLESNNGSIIGNTIMNNSWVGIYISDSNENIFYDNIVAHNSIGIWITSPSSLLNTVYHNIFIDNINQASDFGSGTIWDDGYPSGGNFWSDYTGADLYSGQYQNETGSDRIGDTPYIVYAYTSPVNEDKYPLMSPWGIVPIPGDVNFDEMVNLIDVVLAALAFGSAAVDDPNTPWDESKNWNPYADLNNDGIINILDLVTIGINYGKTV